MFENQPQPESDGLDQPAADEVAVADDPITSLERERDEMKAIAQRAQADLLNYQRRTEQGRQQIARDASSRVLARLLPIVDDLHRAVAELPADAPESWRNGVELTFANAVAFLSSEGVTMLEPAPGDLFDPAQHEAIFSEPSSEQPPGCVLRTFRAGYCSADRILRVAQVVVAAQPLPDGNESTNNNDQSEE